MGGVEQDHRQPVRMGTEPPPPRSESSISRRILRTVKNRVSSGVNSVLTKFRSSAHSPLVEDAHETGSQDNAASGSTAKSPTREERIERIGKLLEQITKKHLFWEQDVTTFFERINEVFDSETYGPNDACNQDCCKAVVGIAHFLFNEDEKWVGELKGFGVPKYFGWAAMNSTQENVRKVALMFLIKSEGREAVDKLTGG